MKKLLVKEPIKSEVALSFAPGDVVVEVGKKTERVVTSATIGGGILRYATDKDPFVFVDGATLALVKRATAVSLRKATVVIREAFAEDEAGEEDGERYWEEDNDWDNDEEDEGY